MNSVIESFISLPLLPNRQLSARPRPPLARTPTCLLAYTPRRRYEGVIRARRHVGERRHDPFTLASSLFHTPSIPPLFSLLPSLSLPLTPPPSPSPNFPISVSLLAGGDANFTELMLIPRPNSGSFSSCSYLIQVHPPAVHSCSSLFNSWPLPQRAGERERRMKGSVGLRHRCCVNRAHLGSRTASQV